jgi:hypothetical protein
MTAVVAEALVNEYVKVRNRRDGAAKRLAFAEAQQVHETKLLEEANCDLDELRAAILQYGGLIPHDTPALLPGEEPYKDDPPEPTA